MSTVGQVRGGALLIGGDGVGADATGGGEGIGRGAATGANGFEVEAADARDATGAGANGLKGVAAAEEDADVFKANGLALTEAAVATGREGEEVLKGLGDEATTVSPVLGSPPKMRLPKSS